MGTYWSPHDDKAQEKYIRSKVKAELLVSKKVDGKTSKGESSAVELEPRSVQEIRS